MPKQRPAAILDVDGTLVERSLILAFVADVFGNSYPYRDGIADVAARYIERRKQGEKPNYAVVAAEVLYHWVNGTVGHEQAWLQRQGREFVTGYDGTYDEVPDVLRTLTTHEYDIAIVSLSPEEVLVPFAEAITPPGIDVDVYGTRLEVGPDGRYTGGLERNLIRDGKDDLVEEILAEANRNASIAMGDEETDVPVLAAVGQPVPISGALREVARERGWPWYEDFPVVAADIDRIVDEAHSS